MTHEFPPLFSTLCSLLFALHAEQVIAQGRWIEVPLPAQDTTLFRISFVDSVHGWIAGRSGIILATADGGDTWRADSIATTLPIFEFKFVSPTVGWVLASNPGPPPPGLQRGLYKSTDSGLTWVEKALPESLYVTAISFTSESLVRVAGAWQLWATTDGAESWLMRSAFPAPTCSPASLDFYDEIHGYVGGGWLIPSSCVGFLETTDGGFSWIDRWWWSPEGNIIFRLLDGRLGMFWLEYFVPDPPQYQEQLSLTWNRGISNQVFVNIPGSFGAFYLGWTPDSTSVWLLRRNGQVLRKAGPGSAWQEDTLIVPIVEMLCDTYGHRLALGRGRLFRFDIGTDVPDEKERPTEFSLCQNYPNPFNPSTQINFDLPAPAHVSLVVYDVLGRKVAELINGERQAGYHSVSWNAGGDVASGVYFARYTAADGEGKQVFAKNLKLLLMK